MSEFYKAKVEDLTKDQLAEIINLQTEQSLAAAAIMKIAKAELSKKDEIIRVLKEALQFYGNPVVNEKEWMQDYSNFDPHPPLRATTNGHGKTARQTLLKIKEMEKKYVLYFVLMFSRKANVYYRTIPKLG